jgi:hypothetical protein
MCGPHLGGQGDGKQEFTFDFATERQVSNPRTVQLHPFLMKAVHARAATLTVRLAEHTPTSSNEASFYLPAK